MSWDLSAYRGAPLGAPTTAPANPAGPLRFYVQRRRLDSAGYDSGGAYWGRGAPLFHYMSEDREAEGHLRAHGRDAAKRKLVALYPQARFYR